MIVISIKKGLIKKINRYLVCVVCTPSTILYAISSPVQFSGVGRCIICKLTACSKWSIGYSVALDTNWIIASVLTWIITGLKERFEKKEWSFKDRFRNCFYSCQYKAFIIQNIQSSFHLSRQRSTNKSKQKKNVYVIIQKVSWYKILSLDNYRERLFLTKNADGKKDIYHYWTVLLSLHVVMQRRSEIPWKNLWKRAEFNDNVIISYTKDNYKNLIKFCTPTKISLHLW